MTHDELPGELTTFRAVGATGFGLGALGGLVLWVAQPEGIRSEPVALLTTALCLALAVAMAAVPWERIGSGWLLVPPLVGVAVIAAAIQNMEGGRAVYDGFYLYVALAASYFLPGRHLRFVIAAIAIAAAVPLLGDAGAESVVRWTYIAGGTAAMAFVLRKARKQVREYAAQVRKLALVDQLTGALNRRGFESRANAELSRARRHEQEVTLIYLDLDGFKQVNDNLGHAAGDVVLRRAAISMGATLRGEDVLARVGGDEFVALLGLATTEDARSIAERLIGAVRRVATQDEGSSHVSATTACATFPHDGQTLDELMRAADGRLLARKRARAAAGALSARGPQPMPERALPWRREQSSWGPRELSRLRVIEALLRRPGSSRAQVGEETGLSRPTVAAVLDELERAGLVEQSAPNADCGRRGARRSRCAWRRGRRSRSGSTSGTATSAPRCATCRRSRWRTTGRRRRSTASRRPRSTSRRRSCAGCSSARTPTPATSSASGWGWRRRSTRPAATAYVEGILPGWSGLRPAAEMEARLGLPVMLENDANAGALGEHRFGVARGASQVVYVRLSAGVGLGLILDGVPYRGRLGIAGELGHVRAVASGGALCRCGNTGCLETVASAAAVADALGVHVPRVVELVAAGDERARRAVASAGEAVGAAVAAVVNVLNPELVVIGGELAGTGELLLEPLRQAIGARSSGRRGRRSRCGWARSGSAPRCSARRRSSWRRRRAG